ncbi:MAG: hypothetical protein LBI72_09355 [Flavobacteriaceae bacterium]|jgi:hypothetical protein|nr:hypothetical protein [Flavobacteriaceae bacterium]
MTKDTLGVTLRVIAAMLVCFIVHYVLFAFTNIGQSFVQLGYDLPVLYGFEVIFSIGIILAMVGIKSSMPNSLGYVFLGFITLRLFASYLFVKEGLDSEQVDEMFKYNFLGTVLIFLAGDGYVAYHVLNKGVDIEK